MINLYQNPHLKVCDQWYFFEKKKKKKILRQCNGTKIGIYILCNSWKDCTTMLFNQGIEKLQLSKK